jgi:hypothetical protein
MRRKRLAGAHAREIKRLLVSKGFSLLREIRFTLPFRETITMGARAGTVCPGRIATQSGAPTGLAFGGPMAGNDSGECRDDPAELTHKSPGLRGHR